MVKRGDVIQQILKDKSKSPVTEYGKTFAPANIALVKYWGKRDTEIRLPVTASLSLSLDNKGTTTSISLSTIGRDQVFFNGDELMPNHVFSQRLCTFLDLFRFTQQFYYRVETHNNIPLAAGFASSASGFAALVLALNQLFAWQLDVHELSILARLGSGSACRSVQPGFMLWHRGIAADGMDCYAESFAEPWSKLCVGLLHLSNQAKQVSSTTAMLASQRGHFYTQWPQQVAQDLPRMQQAITTRDFMLLGQTAENNALAMNACMLAGEPPVLYTQAATIAAMHEVWRQRAQGLQVFFTQDAGANLQLLFLQQDSEQVRLAFPQVEVVKPFSKVAA